jgi:hypothetical protein
MDRLHQSRSIRHPDFYQILMRRHPLERGEALVDRAIRFLTRSSALASGGKYLTT